MPSIAHLILGGIIGLCLYYISDGKFTKTHVFILFLCNYLGPDVGWVLGIGHYTHSLTFWPIFALILAYLYRYFTRFTIKMDGFKRFEIIDLEKPKLRYLNTYFLVLASGIMHICLDGLINDEGMFILIPQIPVLNKEITFTLHDLNLFWNEGLFQINFFLAMQLGIMFIFGFIFVFTYFLKKETKFTGFVVILYILAFMIYFFLVGSISTSFHPDGGAIIYLTVFWITPIALCVLSTRKFKYYRNKEQLKKTHYHNLQIVSIWLLTSGFLALIYSIFGFIFNKEILKRIFSNYKTQVSNYFTYNQVYYLLLSMEIFLLTISLLNFLSAFGLIFKNQKIWRFTILYHLIFLWTLIGLLVACALSENNVKEQFNKNKS